MQVFQTNVNIGAGKKKLHAVTDLIMKKRRASPPEHGEELLIDILLDGEDEDIMLSDALVYVIGGFHTTGNREL